MSNTHKTFVDLDNVEDCNHLLANGNFVDNPTKRMTMFRIFIFSIFVISSWLCQAQTNDLPARRVLDYDMVLKGAKSAITNGFDITSRDKNRIIFIGKPQTGIKFEIEIIDDYGLIFSAKITGVKDVNPDEVNKFNTNVSYDKYSMTHAYIDEAGVVTTHYAWFFESPTTTSEEFIKFLVENFMNQTRRMRAFLSVNRLTINDLIKRNQKK